MSKTNNILKTILGTVILLITTTGCVHSDNLSTGEQEEEFSTEDIYSFGAMTTEELYILEKIQANLDFFFSKPNLSRFDYEALYEIKDTRVLNVEWEGDIIRVNFAKEIDSVLENPDVEDRFMNIVGYGIDEALFNTLSYEGSFPDIERFYGGIPEYKYYDVADEILQDIHPNLELNILKDEQYLKDEESGSLKYLGLQNKRVVTNAGHGYHFKPEKGKRKTETPSEYWKRVLSDELEGRNGSFIYLRGIFVKPIREDIVTAEMTMLLNTLMRDGGARIYPVRKENKRSGRGKVTGEKKWREAGRYNLMRHLKDLPDGERNNIINRFDLLTKKHQRNQAIINWLDIYSRPLYANYMNADAYVSIHTNGFNGSARGLEIYHPKNNCLKSGKHPYKSQSKHLAVVVFTAMLGEIRNDFPDFPAHTGSTNEYEAVKNKNKAEIRCAEQPAILVEVAYHDNVQDAALLANEEFRHLAMKGVADGVEAYFDGIRGPPKPLTPVGTSTIRPTLRWKTVQKNRKYNVQIYRLVDGKVDSLVYEKKNINGSEHTVEGDVLKNKNVYRWTVGVVYSGNKKNKLKELKSLAHLDFTVNVPSKHGSVDININGNPTDVLICLEGPDHNVPPVCTHAKDSFTYEDLEPGNYTICFWDINYREERELYSNKYYPKDPTTGKFVERDKESGQGLLKVPITVQEGGQKEISIEYGRYTSTLTVSVANIPPKSAVIVCLYEEEGPPPPGTSVGCTYESQFLAERRIKNEGTFYSLYPGQYTLWFNWNTGGLSGHHYAPLAEGNFPESKARWITPPATISIEIQPGTDKKLLPVNYKRYTVEISGTISGNVYAQVLQLFPSNCNSCYYSSLTDIDSYKFPPIWPNTDALLNIGPLYDGTHIYLAKKPSTGGLPSKAEIEKFDVTKDHLNIEAGKDKNIPITYVRYTSNLKVSASGNPSDAYFGPYCLPGHCTNGNGTIPRHDGTPNNNTFRGLWPDRWKVTYPPTYKHYKNSNGGNCTKRYEADTDIIDVPFGKTISVNGSYREVYDSCDPLSMRNDWPNGNVSMLRDRNHYVNF